MFQLQSSVDQTVWLELTSHFIDSVQIWLDQQPGLSASQSIRITLPVFDHCPTTGMRPHNTLIFLNRFRLKPDVPYTVYIRGWVPPADVLKFDVICGIRLISGDISTRGCGLGRFYWACAYVRFVTLVSYVFHPRRIYLYYCGYILCMSIYALLNDGWGMFLPHPLRWFDSTSHIVHWFVFGLLFLMLFTRRFLIINVKTKRVVAATESGLGVLLLLNIITVVVDYGILHHRLELARVGHYTGLSILALCGLLCWVTVADAIHRRFRPVWLYIGSVLVWLFFYIVNMFVVNTGWMTDPFLVCLSSDCTAGRDWLYFRWLIVPAAHHSGVATATSGPGTGSATGLARSREQQQVEELKALRLQNELQQQRERLARDLHDGIGKPIDAHCRTVGYLIYS